MQELSGRLSDEDLYGSQEAKQVLEKLHALVGGKYFNNKAQVVEGLMSLVKLMNLHQNAVFANIFIGATCYQQIEKNITGGKTEFKIVMLKSALGVLEGSKVVL